MPEPDTLTITADPEEVRDLLAWIRRDPELRSARAELVRPRQTGGQMGGLADTIVAVVTNEAVLSAATTTIGLWLGSRFRRTRIRLKRGDIEVEIETASAKRGEAYAQELFNELARPEKPEAISAPE